MYFEKEGPENTRPTLELAVKTAKERGIKKLLIATTSGGNPSQLPDTEGLEVIVITHVYGFRTPGHNTLSEEMRAEFIKKGYKVATMAHTLSGAERSLSTTFGGVYPVEIIAHTLRMLGQGTKVCVEIGAMACDCGLAMPGEQVVAIAGSGSGADTAIILRPENTNRILGTKIDEIICKPIEQTEK